MSACPALASGDAFLGSLLAHVDCQGRTLGLAGYQALADPGSNMGLVLTGALTLFVALLGLRMALGEPLTRRGMVDSVVRVGVVLMLATSWPAYRTLVYDVVVEGPAELTRSIAVPAALPGAQGDLASRLQRIDVAIVRLTDRGTGREPNAALPSSEPGAPLRRYPVADDPAFGWARVIFLTGIIASFSVIRLTAGVLLALTPLFAGLLLFAPARAFVAGWVRTLAFCVLGSVTTAVVLGVELALLEPWLAGLLQTRASGAVTASAPVELLVLCGGFSLCLLGALAILLKLAFTLHLPAWPAVRLSPPASDAPPLPSAGPDRSPAPPPAPESASSTTERTAPRAAAIADSLAAAQRREAAARATGADPARIVAVTPVGGTAPHAPPPATAPTGARRSKPRSSLAAAYRDRRS